MWFLVLIFGWPLVEIGLFVTLGGWLGLWLSLAIVIGTALLGVALTRMQGLQVNLSVRDAIRQGRNPGPMMARGAVRVLAGVMLMLPGFLTDILGLLLLLPPVQLALFAVIARAAAARAPGRRSQAGPVSDDVIDGEWTQIPADKGTKSGWTRH